MLICYEIYTEPEITRLSPKAEKLMIKAHEALMERNPKPAEIYLKQALEIEPTYPSLLFNLGASYMMQKREEEAEEIFRKLHQEHPDYLFATVSIAKLCLKRKQVDEAKELIKPLTKRKRLHISEFRAMCDANMELLMAQKDKEAACSWLKIWEALDDDSYELIHWRFRLESASSLLKQLILGKGK